MSKMSRRKQSKPQHISNGSDEEDSPSTAPNLKDEHKDPNSGKPDSKSADPVVKFVRVTRKQAQLLKAKEGDDTVTDLEDHKVKATKETNNNDKTLSETEAEESEQEDTATELPEQEPSALTPKTTNHQPMTTDHPRLRDRTCEYCGAVKPTPAALARHLRKHTGERPFVCQGCNKAYKAKRSLQLHQLTYHPELVNKPPPHQPGAGVSLCTSSLLREALESRIKQDLTNYSGPHLDETTGEFIEDADGQEVNHVAEPPEKDREKEPVSMIGALLSKTVDMPTVHKIAYAAEGQKYDEEESAEKLSNRTCNICGKVCSKPCDLKRHILMHTGERPYKCEVCGKCFKAKASMLYHQRAAHNMAVELSQGLEERYLRLKNRALMKSLHVQDQILERERALLAAGSGGQDVEELDDMEEIDSELAEVNSSSSCNTDKWIKYNDDFTQNINRQISNTSEGSVIDEDSLLNDSLENGHEGTIVDDGEFTCSKLRIRNETVIVTRLDGVNSVTGKEVTMFKCYICGRMFSSLSRVQCHLSMHFELEITTYQCKYCDATFKHKSLMVQHVLKHKIKGENVDGTDNAMSDEEDYHVKDEPTDTQNENSGISPSSESDNTKVRSDGSETSPDLNQMKPNRFNGVHECKFCRKTFSRQFLLQRHERIHTGQKAFYCKECGKGFSESVNLSQHMSLFHADSTLSKQGTRGFNRAKHRSLLRIAYWDKFPGRAPDQEGEGDDTEPAPPATLPKRPEEEQNQKDMEQAKEMLEKDGIKEEVTVVMPSAPPTNTSDPPPTNQTTEPPSETKAEEKDPEENSNSEIMTAPKRSLISFCKDGPPVKSRRKSAAPTKLGNLSPGSNTASTAKSSSPDLDLKIKQEILEESEGEASVPPPPHSVSSGDEMTVAYSTASMIASMNPLLLANHAAGPCLLGAGLLPRLPSASNLSVSAMMNLPISVQVPNEPPTTKSPSPTQSCSSNSQASPADPDMLVGCPRVQWNASSGADSPPLSYGRDSSDRKPLPDWHPLSKLALNQIVTHDGRKVTSLSRTHSRKFSARLHVVNQPVDREQVCKPTILADGRTVYRCVFCSKDFLSFSDINRHMDFHEDIRPYKCQYCDYYARTNSQLKVHMMRHQGIREFCCKLCNYKGVTQSDLNRHMKSQIHMLKSRNECQRCGEGFVTPKNLEKHLEGNCLTKVHKSESLDSGEYNDSV
ncbi:uncharacterized protein LOC124136795 isoform X1 [Haliotis rufescens]|uniref:uncharacterized protein LOC124136795 isoform X1 n=1 Tax=Haliotis rufescens TaxID=6454 RepID=UPI00201EEB6E|nr:uncharacterized protein LOC124136795 isoform X1 [Haliotis rufescens]